MANTWATPEEASDIAGVTLFQSDLDSAQSIIDLYTDIHYGLVNELQERTLRILKNALAWQAKFMKEQGTEDFGTTTEKQSERSEERRGGKEGVSTCRSRGTPVHKK